MLQPKQLKHPSIVLLISSLAGGGAERVMSEIANYYAEIGLHVTLVTLDAPERRSAYRLNSKVEQKNFYSPFGKTKFTKRIAQIKRIVRLRHYLQMTQPDAVLSFMTPTNIIAILACIGLNVRCVVSERIHPAKFSYGRVTDSLRSLLYRFAASVVVQTPEIARWFESRIPGRYVVIPNFVRKFSPPPNINPELRIVAVGRLDRQKAFDDLINSFALISNRFPDWHLDIIGEGAERPVLQALIGRHHLQDNVCLHGFVDNPDVLVRSASIAAQPSRFEGFPNALLEAMAGGLAVLASYEAGDMLIEDGINGLLVRAGDIAQLANALERLMDLPQLRAELGKNALAVQTTYSRERVMLLWDNVLFPALPA